MTGPEQVRVGDRLPPLVVQLTPTLVVATAIASRDFQDVHHDPVAARTRGAPDIFMNILATNGFVGRFVTDWAGPDAVLRRVAIRLGAPNYPGDAMELTGAVTGVAVEPDGARQVTVCVVGRNRLGEHVRGSVELRLPGGAG